MLRTLALSVLIVATPTSASAGSADRYGSGRVAWVTDGDTFRLDSGERIRIAGIDAPEAHRDQARCAGEIVRGMRAKDRATSLLAGRTVTFHRVGRSYKRTVATVLLDGDDLGTKLVRLGIAAWWPRGRPKPLWCRRTS
ncbi:thermonuclease family protein [Sphingobium sp. CAP-1]|uniref:thermonuclease family protein n=1 Tax=Sphingobium sp. CAP-1 TaxID=2676077 RepID=UPI001E63A7B5|nr:thermonuclease family protein [Sphingobium sp. CAP-1]